jgi:SAM-dependent methyltransferase
MPERRARTDRRAGGATTPRRARALIQICDLRPTDHVLDVGCGDGEVAVAVAGHVERLHGLDVRGERVRLAAQLAAEQGVSNASFEEAAIQDYAFAPRSWDVTLFLRIWGQGEGTRKVGEVELERVLRTTRRQAIIQAGKPRSEDNVRRVMEICDDNGFDAAWFVSRKLIVANRRGADARVHALPERVLVSSASESVLVPAEAVPDHPMIRSFDPNLRAAV